MDEKFENKFETVIKQITSHPAVKEISNIKKTAQACSITAIFEVSLPSNCKISKVSSLTGVKLHEPVILEFSSSYPFKAPVIKLRKDFNRDLPHLNPSDLDDFVLPCIYDGDLSDLLNQGDGLNPVLDHISEWFKKAASNTLIDPQQGWEPIRRDVLKYFISYDLSSLRKSISSKAGSKYFLCKYIFSTVIGRSIIDNYTPQFCNAIFLQNQLDQKHLNSGEAGITIALLTWPGKSKISTNYLPENIKNLGDLIIRAADYGCENFTDQLPCLFLELSKLDKKVDKVFVILCSRRPFKIINDDSDFELIPYLIHLNPKTLPSLDSKTQVDSVVHLHSVSSSLLRKLSYKADSGINNEIAQIGCGSLGSKIILHLARAGHGPFSLYDKDFFLTHNLTRHAIYSNPNEWDFDYKAESLKKIIITNFGQKAEAFNKDVIDHIRAKGLPKGAKIIIDSSASVSVREFLATLPLDKVPGKLIHTALYNSGEMGLILIEGTDRNPRIDDLLVAFWDKSLEETRISKQVNTIELGFGRQSIGQGCSSYTMIMSDSRTSLYSAGMAEKINGLLLNSSKKGEYCFGLLAENELGVNWSSGTLDETVILMEAEWEIRVLSPVARAIIEESKKSYKESGGILIGHMFPNRRCVVISRILPPPPDSISTVSNFILGTEGLKDKIRAIQDKSGRLLTYIGTWHSHPNGGGPSSQDKETLEKMRSLRLGVPTINLIFAPEKIYASVDHGDF